MWGSARGGVLARRGLSAGACCTFSLSELAAATDQPPADYVYAEPDASGALWSRAGAAALAVRARLAPAAGRNAALGVAGAWREARLRLRLTADVPPLQELLLWPDADALAALDLPFLTPLNISGSKRYSCHKCGTEFEYPNPLKIHLFMGCQEYTHIDFWRRCLARFRELAAEPAADARSATSWPPAPLPPPAPAPLSPGALEALAAAWGRSRDGHVCVYCGKLYSRKYGLKIHIRTHTGYKPLRCRHCLRAFGDPSNLNKHVRLHARGSAADAHACGLCGAALARRRDLERHMRSRHASATL